ncbi:MAG: hypothetical protein ABI759_24135, partial [Candidatus Solibacter sp.]
SGPMKQAPTPRETVGMAAEYKACGGTGWVCEDHDNKPWGDASTSDDACHCGGAGMPCPMCNPSDPDNPPKMPDGYRTIFDKDGWRH